MISSNKGLIGIGIYTPEEAARHVRVKINTMNRWVFGNATGEPVFRSQLANAGENEKLVTFLDFIQILAVRQIRIREKSFPLQRIRAACDLATETYKIEFPLAARDHRIYLFGPNDNPKKCEIVISIGTDEYGVDKYMQLTGRETGNFVIHEIAEPFMRDVKFGDSLFAEEYTAWEKDGRKIIMNPHKRLGDPFLPSCGYTAIALWEAYVAEGSVERAASAYGVEALDIELACEYFDHLTGRDAA